MSQYFKLTYQRKQIVTDFIGVKVLRETTHLITEVVGGLPAMTVANYRKVLGDQVISVEPDDSYGQSEPAPRGGVKRDAKITRRETPMRKVMGPGVAVAEEDDTAFTGSYAGLISKLAAKESAA